VDIGPVDQLNTADDEDDPSFTADGLELYFNSNRNGNGELFRSIRASLDDPWGAPSAVAEINAAGSLNNPVVSPSGLRLWMSMPGSAGGQDIFVATRNNRSDSWSAPTEVTELNDAADNYFGASNGAHTEAWTMRIPGSGQRWVLGHATRTSNADPWGSWQAADELNGSQDVAEPWLSLDGLHLYYRQAHGTNAEILRCVRTDAAEPFTAPAVVDELSIPYAADVWLLPDQSYVMFAVGDSGSRDLHHAQR
jgi:hypothetical protein